MADFRTTRRVADEIPAKDGSQLALAVVRLAPGAAGTIAGGDDDVLVFVFEGSGERGDEQTPMEAGSAVFRAAGESVDLTAGANGLGFVRFDVGGGCDRHAPLGERAHTAKVTDDTDAATGTRSFQVLFGPHNGSERATLFVGYVGPGAAPWHFHQYDEIVWIWNGSGRYHLAEGVADFAAGSAFRVWPREVHIVENTGEQLVLLGLFTPAGSPSAAYLADDPR